MVVGVNHTLTDNANYLSIGVYNALDLTGVADTSQTNPAAVGFESGDLTGSATAVLEELGLYDMASERLKRDLPRLFVTLVSRSCPYAAAYCINLNGTSLIPASSPVTLTQRAYLKPGTTTGANPDVMVDTEVIAVGGFLQLSDL